jgi:uncharacterized protein (DUF305 family)
MPRSAVARVFVLGALMGLAGCGGARAGSSGAPMTPAELSRADGGIPPYTEADVRFMSGMIPHHAQAVLIARWAESHGASESVQALCERIVVGQQDEIALMQRWLRNRGETVPDGDPAHSAMPGMSHALMPGMLTADQVAKLDLARGVEFDKLFLEYMIQHHEGAITMVDALFASSGAAQDDDVFRFATDVFADQTTEIERMGLMLAALASAPS